jgi:putative oxidoreductase
MERTLDLAGRLLLASLFAAGAAQKLADPGPVQGLLAGAGLPPVLVWPAAALNAGLAAALALGWRLRGAASAGAAYCAATSLFHLIPADPWQMSIFVKNWAIAGGMLCLAARSRPG